MNLEEALSAPAAPERVDRAKPYIPKVGEPGTREWDGNQGVINTTPTLENVTQYDEFLKDAFPGIDPAELEVIEPVQVRGWDTNTGEGNIVRMHYYRLNVRRKRTGPSIEELLSRVASSSAKKQNNTSGSSTFVVALGDLQLGKMDGDGVEGTIDRVNSGIEASVSKLIEARRTSSIGAVHLAFLGDCIEGFVSQAGASAWRTNLTLTEQIRLLREVMFFAVESLSPYVDTMSVVAVPGNHDQAIRFGKGGVTRYDDSHDVDALSAVEFACKKATQFEHVNFYTPERDELTVTLETSGTIIGMAHGHQMKSRQHFNWWQGQAFGDFPIGQADILLTGHFHHLLIEQSGKRTFIQVPALEQESTWFRHNTGESGNPGVLNFITQDKKISSLEVV